MKYIEQFPIYNTKVDGITSTFDLNTISGRRKYFNAKAGKDIKKIKEYLKHNTFIAFLLAKKSAGKGTYTKLMMEIFGEDLIGHISVGDIIRSTYKDIQNKKKKEELKIFLEKNYRGFISIDEAIDTLEGKTQSKLLPTEFTLALVKREIERQDQKVLFIDGFPRGVDQIPYTLFFRELINLRDDPDLFVTIDTPESVIEVRMKSRVVCPSCNTPRNIQLLPTKHIGFDYIENNFYLMCDNPECKKERMIKKEGDIDGLTSIRERLDLDEKLIEMIHSLHGVTRIHLRSSLYNESALKYADAYELTNEYFYTNEDGEIKTHKRFFSAIDDNGNEICSLTAPAVILQLIGQLVNSLEL